MELSCAPVGEHNGHSVCPTRDSALRSHDVLDADTVVSVLAPEREEQRGVEIPGLHLVLDGRLDPGLRREVEHGYGRLLLEAVRTALGVLGEDCNGVCAHWHSAEILHEGHVAVLHHGLKRQPLPALGKLHHHWVVAGRDEVGVGMHKLVALLLDRAHGERYGELQHVTLYVLDPCHLAVVIVTVAIHNLLTYCQSLKFAPVPHIQARGYFKRSVAEIKEVKDTLLRVFRVCHATAVVEHELGAVIVQIGVAFLAVRRGVTF